MTRLIAVALATLALSGCGKDPISETEARDIASMSQDADQYLDQFTKAIQQLSTEKSCQPEVMRDQGGFSRDSDGDYYFIPCGTLYNDSNYQTWYFNPSKDKLARVENEVK